jgi:hypothetical protein
MKMLRKLLHLYFYRRVDIVPNGFIELHIFEVNF